MFTFSHPALRTAALAALLGGAGFASAHAAPLDTSTPAGPPSTTMNLFSSGSSNSTASTGSSMGMKSQAASSHMMQPARYTAQSMADRVEKRISTLHAKLMITPEQEQSWGAVAEAMRDNEATMSDMIQERHQNAKSLTAVDDLESYQSIAQAHAEGLQKVIVAFKPLYNEMSDQQKQNADAIFGKFEGRMGHEGMGHKGMMKKGAMMKQPAAPVSGQ